MSFGYQVLGFGSSANAGDGSVFPDENIVTDQLYWHVDASNSNSYSGSGTTWTDLISGRNATLISNPTYSNSSGNGLGAFFFDGAGDYATTSFTKDQDAFSMQAWFKPSTQLSGGQHSLMNSFESNSAEWWGLSVEGTGRGNAIWIIDNDSDKKQIQNNSQVADSWQMITGTRSGGTMKLYVNTSLLGTVTNLSTSTMTAVEPFWIASRSTGYSESYKGYISDLKMYTKELSASNITQNYNTIKGRYGL
jgi:hypothetical protein